MVRSHAIIRLILYTSLFVALAGVGEVSSQVIPTGYVPRIARIQPASGGLLRTAMTRQVARQTAGGHSSFVSEAGPPPPPVLSDTKTASVMVPSQSAEQVPVPAAPALTTDSPKVLGMPEVPAYPETGPIVSDSMANSMASYPTGTCDAPGCDNWLCDGGPNCGAAAYGGCDTCGGPCSGSCHGGYHWIDTLSLHVGVQGFKNGVNRGESGSFGFFEGFNWGSPWVFTPLGMNTQIGFRGSQSDFHGAAFTTQHRGQYFVTAGFFKRSLHGVQCGIVFDYLHDDWYTTIDLAQVRGELSLVAPTGNSLGFAFAQSVSDDDTSSVLNGQRINESWETQDYYTLFWEKQTHSCRYGKLRIYGGATGESDAIFGTQFKIPLYDNFSLESEFTYLVPNEGAAQGGTENEAWNVALQLVWYPARSMQRANHHDDAYVRCRGQRQHALAAQVELAECGRGNARSLAFRRRRCRLTSLCPRIF